MVPHPPLERSMPIDVRRSLRLSQNGLSNTISNAALSQLTGLRSVTLHTAAVVCRCRCWNARATRRCIVGPELLAYSVFNSVKIMFMSSYCISSRLLSVSGNAVGGTLPSAVGTLTMLTALDVSSNSFSGELFRKISTLTGLRCVFAYNLVPMS